MLDTHYIPILASNWYNTSSMYIHMCACSCMWRCTCMLAVCTCMCEHVKARDQFRCHSSDTTWFSLEIGSFIDLELIKWLSGYWAPGISLCLSPWGWDCKCTWATMHFKCGFWGMKLMPLGLWGRQINNWVNSPDLVQHLRKEYYPVCSWD